MGAWGISLYSNDTCRDVRNLYIDKLKKGVNNQDATAAVLSVFQELVGDEEEEPLFWFALADTQWDYGRLQPEVKEKALYWLNRNEELERWCENGQKLFEEWVDTRRKLREKLEATPPPEKKATKHRSYRDSWKLGDVFAYRFCSNVDQLKGMARAYMNMFPPDPWLCGKYMIIRKVSERSWWPDSIIPELCAYRWIGERIPSLDEIRKMPKQPMMYPEATGVYEKTWKLGGTERENLIKKNESFVLVKTTAQSFPKDKVIYLGNLSGNDLVPFSGKDTQGKTTVEWFSMERFFFEYYKAWKEFDIEKTNCSD
ncbi:MAG: hypothetical protein ILP12_03975 [Lachnospiraceae bacterium]|nr:hypothetical protein [Lachnospiraceae bacterium]